MNAGQSHVAKDARVGPSDPIGSGARWASSAAEAPEEDMKTLFESVDGEMEIPKENALTTDLKRAKHTKILKKITSNLKRKLQVFSFKVSGNVCQ